MEVSKSQKVILNLSSVDYGGAGQFALNFNSVLIEENYSSYLLVKDSKSNSPFVIEFSQNKYKNIINKIRKRIKKNQIIEKCFNYDYYFYNRYERYSLIKARDILKQIPLIPDFIFVHWVTDFINAETINEFAKLLPNVRIFILMIDNAPITGGCHYPWNCEGYTNDCENCPAIASKKIKNLAKNNLIFKLKHLPSLTKLITFSQNDYLRAQKSVLYKDKEVLKWIGYVDEEKFRPISKKEAKEFWSIPDDKKVLFFGASSLKEKRKGLALLIEALHLINHDNIYLLIAGTDNAFLNYNFNNLKMIGHVDEEHLIKAYQAANLFICPSIEDSGPMMINQSIMCGTPVVAFNTGVAMDLVLPNITGFIVHNEQPKDLACGITALINLDDSSYENMCQNCRSIGLDLYSRKAFLANVQSALGENYE